MQLKKIIHPIYTAKISSSNNSIYFDVRASKVNINNYVLMYRISKPESLKMPSLSILSRQRNKTFENRKNARRYIMELINNF
jgi:hypothetical protein